VLLGSVHRTRDERSGSICSEFVAEKDGIVYYCVMEVRPDYRQRARVGAEPMPFITKLETNVAEVEHE